MLCNDNNNDNNNKINNNDNDNNNAWGIQYDLYYSTEHQLVLVENGLLSGPGGAIQEYTQVTELH